MGLFTDTILPLLGLGAISWALLFIYRLYLHPLASFPGPKSILALGVWHEVYHDVVRGGQFHWEIEKMHDQYGPIVRINPNELHIQDADFFATLYAPSGGGKLRYKYPWFCNTFGAPTSIIATSEHELHRARRNPLNGFFSTKAVTNLEPLILEKVRKLVSRLEDTTSTEEVLRMDCAFNATAMDVICTYAFGFDPGYLSQKDFGLLWKTAVTDMTKGGALVRAFPWILTASEMMPPWLVRLINPALLAYLDCQSVVRENVARVLAETPSSRTKGPSAEGPTIFHALRDSDLPPEERSLPRLANEAIIIISAATGTTSRTLEVLFVHLLLNPPLLRRLQKDLDSHIPDPTQPITSTSLRQIPLLTALILESLRLGLGMSTRNPRVSPSLPIPYRAFTIPPGTPISESIPFVLLDPQIFPSPKTFDPERWMGADAAGLEPYKVFFGKGSRACIGMNLAYAELYLIVGLVLRRVELELVDTGVDEVEFVRDYFGAAPADASKGVRMRVVGLRD